MVSSFVCRGLQGQLGNIREQIRGLEKENSGACGELYLRPDETPARACELCVKVKALARRLMNIFSMCIIEIFKMF